MSPTIESTPRTLLEKFVDALPGILAAGVIAFGTSYLGVQRGQAVMEERVTTAESENKDRKEEIRKAVEGSMPRQEFQAYLQGLSTQLTEIKSDVKEIRARQDEVLTRLPRQR